MTDTIGQQLKNARESQNLSLKQVMEELHIREAYLQAMEENRLETALPAVQAKGFLRIYSEFLGITLFDKTADPGSKAYEAITSEETDTQSPSPENDSVDKTEKEDATKVVGSNTENTFGSLFANVRTENSSSLADIEGDLHISQSYLKAIEEEDFEVLPQGIQARGMIQRYAEFLELDVEDVLGRYADHLLGLQSVVISDKDKRKQARKVDGAKQLLTPDLLIGIVFLIILFAIGYFSIRWVLNTRSIMVTNEPTVAVSFSTRTTTPNPDETELEETMQGTAVPGEVSTSTLQIRPTSENQGNSASRVILQIIANQRAYLRITADGETVFDGRVKGGNFYEFFAEEKIELITGNAAALDITVLQDGRETRLGLLGVVGQVVNLTFQPDVIITPTVTPSLTPTITNTPLPSATPTITSSPTPNEEP